jgi:hypothetical protein
MSALQAHARSEGYEIVVKRSEKTGRLWLQCDRGGICRASSANLVRRIATRKCNCPFQLYAVDKLDRQCHLRVKNSERNHDPSALTSSHSIHFRLTTAEQSLVKTLSQAGEFLRQIMATICQDNPQTAATPRVFTMLDQVRKENLWQLEDRSRLWLMY